MVKCPSGKKTYESKELAVDALLHARATFSYSSGGGPIAVYKCEDCGHFHLTSKGKMDLALEAHLKSGKIKLQGEANYWLDRIKKSNW